MVGNGVASRWLRSRLVSLGLATALLASVGLAGWAGAADAYPEWFLRAPTVEGMRAAVGYAPLYGDTAASIAEALANGLGALRLGADVRIRAEYLQEILPDGSVAYRGEQYAEDTLAAPVAGTAIDTVVLRRMVLLLVATGDAPVARGLRFVSSTAPDWTVATPASRDGIFAIGTAAAHFNEHEAWLDAERHARRTLAFGVVTQLRSTMESRTGGTSDGALVATTATELRDVEVRERWRDARRLFVLVHARPVRRPES